MAINRDGTPTPEDAELGTPTPEDAELARAPKRKPREKKEQNPAGVKPDNIELARRIEILTNLVIRGYPRAEIRRYVITQTDWAVSDMTFQRYMKRVEAELRRDGERVREHEVAKALRRNDFVFQRSVADKDYRTALRANLQNARLLGLEAPTVTRTGQDPNSDPAPGTVINTGVTINFVENTE